VDYSGGDERERARARNLKKQKELAKGKPKSGVRDFRLYCNNLDVFHLDGNQILHPELLTIFLNVSVLKLEFLKLIRWKYPVSFASMYLPRFRWQFKRRKKGNSSCPYCSS
jgi:hypothetical protein